MNNPAHKLVTRRALKAARFYAREFYFFAGARDVTPRAFVEGMLADYADNCGDEAMREQGAAFAADASGYGVEVFAAAIIAEAAKLTASGEGANL